tara:strand:- start:224 stop:793 length:570 start_codon:yes stop_codon:yes gene_type:complete
MHELIPFSGWKNHYDLKNDVNSPFFNDQGAPDNGYYHRMYDFIIHPEWDYIGCETLFAKLLFVEYSQGFAVIELLGEWNDALNNDIMEFKRRIIDALIVQRIDKFLMIGDNLLNFHGSEDYYYQEWNEEINDGWIVFMNVRDQIIQEFKNCYLTKYIWFGTSFNMTSWRTQDPLALCQIINQKIALSIK